MRHYTYTTLYTAESISLYAPMFHMFSSLYITSIVMMIMMEILNAILAKASETLKAIVRVRWG